MFDTEYIPIKYNNSVCMYALSNEIVMTITLLKTKQKGYKD